MAHDDMHVVMYKVLAYLYDRMKRGEEPSRAAVLHDGDMLSIPYRYWAQIMAQLAEMGLVKGVSVKWTGNEPQVFMSSPCVTLAGVEFLEEDSMMAKARRFLKEAKSTLPFV